MGKIRKFKTENLKAWSAGLFEGEGCITFSKVYGRKYKDGTFTYPKGRKYPRLSMSLTDEDVLKKFHSIVGGTISKQPKKLLSGKSLWWWSVQGIKTKKIIKIFLPYLGLRRKLRLTEVFGIYNKKEKK